MLQESGSADAGSLCKIHGLGPSIVMLEMVDSYYKFATSSKEFIRLGVYSFSKQVAGV